MSEAQALPCAVCEYDLRVHPREGVCPECGTPVADAVELARNPRRPAWRDSDPRWRRRLIAGACVLTLVPLVDALRQFGLAERIPAGIPYDAWGGVRNLEHTYLPIVYPWLTFCIGFVLLFAKERGRRPDRLDWTRRWGVFGCYVTLLLGVAGIGLITALVMVGVAAVFMSKPLANQPSITPLLVELSAGYIYYGPHYSERWGAVLAICPACVVLLACVPLHHALRATSAVGWSWAVIGPLVLSAVWIVIWAMTDVIRPPPRGWSEVPHLYFQPHVLMSVGRRQSEFWFGAPAGPERWLRFAVELAKWLPILFLAIWLTIAQVRTWRLGTDVGRSA